MVELKTCTAVGRTYYNFISLIKNKKRKIYNVFTIVKLKHSIKVISVTI